MRQDLINPPVCTLYYFAIKRARKKCNKSSNCVHMCLTITKKKKMGSFSYFICKRQFIVIFVIVKHNLKILIVYALVLWQNNTRWYGKNRFLSKRKTLKRENFQMPTFHSTGRPIRLFQKRILKLKSTKWSRNDDKKYKQIGG